MRSNTKKVAEEVTAVKDVLTNKKTQPKRKYEKRSVETRIVVQYSGNEFEPNSFVESAKKAFLSEGGKATDIKTVELYVKPEDNTVYYVINGCLNGKLAIFA